MNEFKVGGDGQGNVVIAFGPNAVCISAADGLRVAATICAVVGQSLAPPQPQVIAPDRRLILPANGN